MNPWRIIHSAPCELRWIRAYTMQSFAEFIAENFESTVDLLWDYRRHGLATARFSVRNVAVTVSFEQMEPDSPWRVSFIAERGQPTEVATAAFELFNGVMQALEEFLDIREPEVLVLVSKTEQLARIYETYLRREGARIERLGYRIEGPVKADPYTEFTLRRTRPSAWRESQDLT